MSFLDNLIVHREYTNAHPATFIIYKDRVETENANIPNGEGPISPESFSPFPKNPLVAKFFIQLGRVDELGSGIINVNKFIKDYAGEGSPQFIEGHTFKIIIPLGGSAETGGKKGEVKFEGVIEGVTEGVKEKLILLLNAISENEGNRIPFYADILNESEKNIERYMKQLREAGLIDFRGASRTGGYFVKSDINS